MGPLSIDWEYDYKKQQKARNIRHRLQRYPTSGNHDRGQGADLYCLQLGGGARRLPIRMTTDSGGFCISSKLFEGPVEKRYGSRLSVLEEKP